MAIQVDPKKSYAILIFCCFASLLLCVPPMFVASLDDLLVRSSRRSEGPYRCLGQIVFCCKITMLYTFCCLQITLCFFLVKYSRTMFFQCSRNPPSFCSNIKSLIQLGPDGFSRISAITCWAWQICTQAWWRRDGGDRAKIVGKIYGKPGGHRVFHRFFIIKERSSLNLAVPFIPFEWMLWTARTERFFSWMLSCKFAIASK